MSDTNSVLKEALLAANAHAKRGVEEEVRMPVNIPVSYKNKLKVMAAVEHTTMKALILEALDQLFETRNVR